MLESKILSMTSFRSPAKLNLLFNSSSEINLFLASIHSVWPINKCLINVGWKLMNITFLKIKRLTVNLGIDRSWEFVSYLSWVFTWRQDGPGNTPVVVCDFPQLPVSPFPRPFQAAVLEILHQAPSELGDQVPIYVNGRKKKVFPHPHCPVLSPTTHLWAI